MKNKITILIGVLLILIISVSLSFAYFTASITGSEVTTSLTISGGVMSITYSGNTPAITLTNIYPKEDEWATKIFTLTGDNTTVLTMDYELYFVVNENGYSPGAIQYTLSSTAQNGAAASQTEYKSINIQSGDLKLGEGYFTPETDGNKTHTYTMKVYFLNKGYPQNNDHNKTFKGYVDVREPALIPNNYELALDSDFTFKIDLEAPNTYDGVQGYYEYTGNKEYVIIPEYINGNKLLDTYKMFYLSEEVLGVANTNDNITNTVEMFAAAYPSSLELIYFDTSNVTNMMSMFGWFSGTTLNLSGLNTSNVTNMSYMFSGASTQRLDLSNFDTSKVTDMSYMFNSAYSSYVDLSSFRTTNLTNMEKMFLSSKFNIIDLSTFDTSNVTNMDLLFYLSNADYIDVSSLDTSNITDMMWMFRESKVKTLDLTSFDTSNVITMVGMFEKALVEEINLTSFDTSSVTDMSSMFSETNLNILDLSSFDLSNVTNMNNMFYMIETTTGYARTISDANKLNALLYKPEDLIFVVK